MGKDTIQSISSPGEGGAILEGSAAGGGEILFGTAGWSYPDWEGRVYPDGKPRGFHPLGYLAGFVDAVEVNSTFYRPASPRISEGWARIVEGRPGFRFSVKLWRGFTHERSELRAGDVRAFREGIAPLSEAGRLGAVLMQFPWSFRAGPESTSWLESLIDAFGGTPLVLEVRHASWARPDFWEWLAERGVGIANIDQPLFSRSIGPSARATSPVGYVRLHGRNFGNWFREGASRDERYDYLYSREELAEWLRRARDVAGASRQTFVIANNHYGGQALVNAIELKHMASDRSVPVPPALLAAFPRLATVAAVEGPRERIPSQGELPL